MVRAGIVADTLNKVPAGYGPGAGHLHPRRFLYPASITVDPNRSPTSASGPAAQGAEDIDAEKAETIQALGRGNGVIAVPRSGAGLGGAAHADPLIAWTAPYGGLYAEPIMPRLRVAEP